MIWAATLIDRNGDFSYGLVGDEQAMVTNIKYMMNKDGAIFEMGNVIDLSDPSVESHDIMEEGDEVSIGVSHARNMPDDPVPFTVFEVRYGFASLDSAKTYIARTNSLLNIWKLFSNNNLQ